MKPIKKICPLCGEKIKGYPATSRVDNKTEICSDCGTREALIPQTSQGFTNLWITAQTIPKGFPALIDKKLGNKKEIQLDGWGKIGTFGVDSGQVLITDPCYVKKFVGDDKQVYDEKKIKKMQKTKKFEYSYNGACARTLGKSQGGSIGIGHDGVVASTGYGDGEYTVRALYREGRVKELRIKFF